MATLTCPSCGWDNEPDETSCLRCSGALSSTPGIRDPPVAAAEPAGARSGFEQCPHCGADVPDSGNVACVDCLLPFTDPATSSPPVPVKDDPRVAGTRRDGLARPLLRLAFSAGGKSLGEIDVGVDDELLIGREPTSDCARLVGVWDNVSRRHAVIGLDADGAAWVRDEHSMNGTTLNDVPVPPGRRSVLRGGDRLRFGADVAADVTCEGAP